MIARAEGLLEAHFGPPLKAAEGRASQAWVAIGPRMYRDAYGRLLLRLLAQQEILEQGRRN